MNALWPQWVLKLAEYGHTLCNALGMVLALTASNVASMHFVVLHLLYNILLYEYVQYIQHSTISVQNVQNSIHYVFLLYSVAYHIVLHVCMYIHMSVVDIIFVPLICMFCVR